MADQKPPSQGLFEDEFVREIASDSVLRNEISDVPSPPPSECINRRKIEGSLDTYSQEELDEAFRRLSYIKWIQKSNKAGWTEKNLNPLLAKVPEHLKGPVPKWRTIAEWRSSYEKAGRSVEALVPQHRKKGNRNQKVVNDSVYYWKAVEEKYMRKERMSIARVYRYYVDLITITNKNLVEGRIKPISKRAFYDRINKLPPYKVAVARYGKNYADRHFREVGVHVPSTRVLERVEIDHTPLNLILLDDELHIPLGRPYLTALIDSYSRCIVGFYIGYREPSYDAVRKALLNAMLRKEWVKNKYPAIKKDWPCSGKIEVLVVDNGAEFWSKDLEDACNAVVGDVQYNPVARPWLKPLIERFFSTVNQKLLNSIPGKTFSNVVQLKDYKPEQDAVMRVSTFMEVFHKWIIDEYHFEPDERETRIPIWTWNDGVAMYPPIQYDGLMSDRLIIELGMVRERTLRKTGVQFLGIYYSSPELSEYRKNAPSSGGKENLKVKVKINPSNLSCVYVYLDKEGRYIRVPSVDSTGYTEGLTLFQHQTNRRVARLLTRSRLELEHLAETRAFIDKRIKDDDFWGRKTKA
ncbi:transposase family protein [Pontibacterium granulatum]|uniref:transposase family protein n=1 Tax=Pontibacterium granulatum TaxID=2036029 RepID=UPI00249A5540|nr:transposase family protein [Pontibacterium granulatum]MDI3326527.1 transposase family protein [Pontibacterium granulatum]